MSEKYNYDLGTLHHGDCLEVLRGYPADSVDSIVSDPPAGIAFMGKGWDDPNAWQFPISKHGFTDGGDRVPAPTVGASSRNPNCRKCKRHKRGWKDIPGCECAEPDFDVLEKHLESRDIFVSWLTEVMRECLRVLKPGGHALIWSIPRTSHWTATAIEEAGFEIRDCIHHVFGCLSEDSEILTEHGWEPYHTLVEGRLALCYDVDHGDFRWQPIQQVYVYPYRDTAYRLLGDRTDQIVSRNHRCLVERGGAYAFEYAEALQREEGVPVLEDVLGLLRALPLPHAGAGVSQPDVLARVLGQEYERHQAPAGADHATREVSGVRSGVPTQEQRLDREGQVLRLQVPGYGSNGRPGTTCATQDDRTSRSQGVDGEEPCFLRPQDDGAAQSCLEGRGDVLLEARELRVGEVRQVPAGVQADGSQGRVRRGAPTPGGGGGGSLSLAVGDGTSHQPRPHGQPSGEPYALHLESGAQVVRASRFTSTDLVRVEPIAYDGIVWCVRVPSGSFVARRAGKAFVTGNSGFPKSLNIGKAIDRMAGRQFVHVDRVKEALQKAFEASGKARSQIDKECGFRAANYLSVKAEGKQPDPWFNVLPSQEKWAKMKAVLGLANPQLDEWFSAAEREIVAYKKTGPGVAFSSEGPTEIPVTAPSTPEAKKWDGWGTQLKPAVETWWLCRKPIEAGNTVSQVLKTGTGGINVDGSRVGTKEDLNGGAYSGERREKDGTWQSEDHSEGKGSGFRPGSGEYQQPQGRWPANMVLSHSDRCTKIGTKKVKNVGGSTSGENAFGQDSGWNDHNRPTEIQRNRDAEGNETIEDWECAQGCPVRALNEQSGDMPPSFRKARTGTSTTNNSMAGFLKNDGAPFGHLDSGGASRFFHNFEPDYDAPFFYTGKITSGERKQDLEEEGLINKHPTVKSVKLMTFLVKLITPPGGTVLDPFAGSGSTLVAAVNNGFRFSGSERDDEYIKIATGRLDKAVEREVLDQDQQDVFDELMNS